MCGKNDSKEPVFSGSERQRRCEHDDLFDSRLLPKDSLDPRLRLAAIAVTLVCALFIADWAYQRYTEYRAVQALKEMVTGVEEAGQAASRSLQRQARESAARRQALTQQNEPETRPSGASVFHLQFSAVSVSNPGSLSTRDWNPRRAWTLSSGNEARSDPDRPTLLPDRLWRREKADSMVHPAS